MNTKKTRLLCILAMLLLSGVKLLAQGPSVGIYNVVWGSPSADHTGLMPLGNGDIAAGVCAIEDDALYLLLAKNDAFSYNGDIFKTGRVKISIDPNPFRKGMSFRQQLDLETGSICIKADAVQIRIWADANRNVYHVQIDSPESVRVKAAPEFWQRIDSVQHNRTSTPIDPPTSDVCLERGGHVLWYYSVGDRSVFPEEMRFYDVEDMIDRYPDPYRFNTFGNLLESAELKLENEVLSGSGRRFDIRIHALTKKAPDVSEWMAAIEQQAAKPLNLEEDWRHHCAWWEGFWKRSWISVSDNSIAPAQRNVISHEGYSSRRAAQDTGALVAQSYNVFRFLMACQSRGAVQAKFNGGLFTQPLLYKAKPRLPATQRADGMWISHEDERLWGRRFTFQNQRLLYWPLFMSGDSDLTRPFFDYYWNLLPVRKAITKAWFGHEGAYYRENIEPTGGERDCGKGKGKVDTSEDKPLKTAPGQNQGKGYYHSYYFTCGLETLAMMIEYVKYSGDTEFRDEVLVPFALEILLFFDRHYQRDAQGKLRIDPAMVLETFWVAVNPAPDVAGLLHNLDELLALKLGTAQDRAHWRRFRREIPDVHLHEIDGKLAIAPAESWAHRRNSENGELYPVFPFKRFGLGFGSADIVSATMANRTLKNAFGYKCWTQDQIHWAYAGDAAEAMDGLVHRFSHSSEECRFPLYGSAGPDSCPDFDHFGSGSTALQRMLVQEAGANILLLPAWPACWDADFKLHLSGQTVITGTVKEGHLQGWDIRPSSRRQDVVVCQTQKLPPKTVIPVNAHPLRLGKDSGGASQFAGEFGRVSMLRGELSSAKISGLRAGARDSLLSGNDVVFSRLAPAVGELTRDQGLFDEAFTLEAWIKPGQSERGRIFDKLKAGDNAGFLLDSWPKLSLRLIVGYVRVSTPENTLGADKWHHVAVVFTRRDVKLYLDGKQL